MKIDELRSKTEELRESIRERCVNLAHFQNAREEIEQVIEPLRRSGSWRTASDVSKEGNQHFAALRYELCSLRKLVSQSVQEIVSLSDKVMDLIEADGHTSAQPVERANNALRQVTDEILDLGGHFEIAPPAEMVYRLLAAGMILSAAVGDSIPEQKTKKRPAKTDQNIREGEPELRVVKAAAKA